MHDEMEPPSAEMTALAGVECLLRELVVALVASGALERHDVAKAILRAELTACSWDGKAEHEATRSPTAQYVALLESALAQRMALKPNLFVLRQERERWIRQGRQGPDPIEAPALPETDG